MSNRKNIQANWHPNFRIESALPDTRAIHTNFIAKVIIYVAVFLTASFVLQREYQAYLLSQNIRELEQQVQDAASADRSRLKKSEQFRELATNVKELQQFFSAPLIAHEAVAELALIKPRDLKFTSLVLSESVLQVKDGKNTRTRIIFNLKVSGNVKDLPLLTQFKRELEESKLLNPSGYTVGIEETIQQRDSETGIIPFQLLVPLEATKDEINNKGSTK